MQPTTSPSVAIKTKRIPKQRHFLAVFFISLIWGIIGVDRMYLGKWGTGLLKLFTAGGFGIWLIFDLAAVMNGSVRDKWGRELLQTAEYKSFASRVVAIYALVVLIGFIATAASAAYVISEYIDNGTLPGLEMLQGTGLTPEQRIEFGL